MDGIDVLDQTATTDTTEESTLTQQDDAQIDTDATDTGDGDASPSTEDPFDGRKVNPEWSKALKELREQFPDRADMLSKLRDGYARYQTLREMAPNGITDVKGWKQLVDTVGGAESAAEMMQRASTMDEMDSMLLAGNPAIYEQLPPEMQAGFDTIVESRFNSMAEADPAKFAALVTPHFAAALAGTGMGKHLESAYAKAEGNPEAQELISQMHAWYTKQTNGAAMPSGKTSTPQQSQAERELADIRKQQDDGFVKGVADTSVKHLGDTFTKNADVYIKSLGLSKEQTEDLMQSFNERITQKLSADAVFQKQLGAYKSMKNRNPETVNSYIRGKIDEHAKATIDSLVTNRYGNMRGKQTPTPKVSATPGGTTNGAQRVAALPDRAEWDEDKMLADGYENTVKKGVFHLKGGRTVQHIR